MEGKVLGTESSRQQHWWGKLCWILLHLLPTIHQHYQWVRTDGRTDGRWRRGSVTHTLARFKVLLLPQQYRMVTSSYCIDAYIVDQGSLTSLLYTRYQELILSHVPQRQFESFEFRWCAGHTSTMLGLFTYISYIPFTFTCFLATFE